MFHFFRKNTVDEKEIIEIKKKIAYMETDVSILKSQYQRLLESIKAKRWPTPDKRKKKII